MDELKENIVRMSSGSADSQAASEWIAAFQQSEVAWLASCQLLDEVDAFKLYGLSILYNKLKSEFSELEDRNQVEDLKKCLFVHLTTLSQSSQVNMVVGRYMALCLSNIFIQVGSDRSIEELFTYLQSILQYSPLIVLEFIKVLPEECQNSSLKISAYKRRKFEEQMGQNLQFILQFLNILWPSSEMDVKVAILNSARSWSKCNLSTGGNAKQSTTNFSSFIGSELITNSLQNLLTSDDTFIPTLNIWIDVLEQCNYIKRKQEGRRRDDSDDEDSESDEALDNPGEDFDVSTVSDILRPYLPVIQKVWTDCVAYMSANGLFEDPENDQDPYGDICIKIADFFNSYADLYIDRILSVEAFDQQLIISQLIECFKCPIPYVGQIVSLFFQSVSNKVCNMRVDEDEGIKSQGEYFASQMMPIYTEILASSIEKSVIPIDRYSLNNSDALDYNYEHRRCCRYTAVDCFNLLDSTQSWELMNSVLQRELSSGDVKPNRIEAIIMIARELDIEGDANSLVDFIFSIPRDNVVMCYTILKFVKSFANRRTMDDADIDGWFAQNPTYTAQALQTVVQCLSNEAIEEDASQVFCDLCEFCDLSAITNDLIQVYTSKSEAGFWSVKSEQYLVEGIMYTLERLEDEECSQGLNLILNLIVSRIQSNGSDAKVIDRQFIVLKGITQSNIREKVFISVFQSLLTLSEGIIATKTSSEDCEEIISFLKNSVRKCEDSIDELCPLMSQFVVSGFTQFKYESFLYLGSVLVRMAPNNENIASMVYNLCSVFSSSVTISPDQNSRELEELLYLIKVSLDNILQYFITFDNFSVIINMVLLCLKQPFNRDIQGKIYDVIAKLYGFSQSGKELEKSQSEVAKGSKYAVEIKKEYEKKLELEAMVYEQLKGGLLAMGPEIVNSSLQSMGCNPFCHALFDSESRSGNLSDMLWSVKAAFDGDGEFAAWLLQAIEGLDPLPKAMAASQGLMGLADVQAREKDSWIIIIKEFTNAIEKRQRK